MSEEQRGLHPGDVRVPKVNSWWRSLQAAVPADRVLSESGSEVCRIGLGSWPEAAATKLIVAMVGVATGTASLDEAVRLKTCLLRHSVFDNGES